MVHGDQRLNGFERRLNGQHGARVIGVRSRHQPAAELRQFKQRRRVEAAGGTEGGQFAVTVPGGCIGPRAEESEHLKCTETHCAKRRLSHGCSPQRIVVGGSIGGGKRRLRIDAVTEPRVAGIDESGREGAIGFSEHVLKSRKCTRQIAQHADVLSALAGKEETKPAGIRARAVGHALRRRAGRIIQPAIDRCEIWQWIALRHDDEAVQRGWIEGALGLGRAGAKRNPTLIPIAQVRSQFRNRRSGQRENRQVARPIDFGFAALVLFEHAVEIRSAEAEGADAGAARMGFARQPGAAFGVDVERRRARLDERLGDFDRRRQNLVVERQRRLDETGRASGCLGMTQL